MKLKYTVRYKIKRDYPETDLEGEFNVYSCPNSKYDLYYEALKKIKEEFSGIDKAYTDNELLNFMSFHYEYPVQECYICGEIFDIDALDFYEVVFTKPSEMRTDKMVFCKNCFFGLMDEIHSRRYKKLNLEIKNE